MARANLALALIVVLGGCHLIFPFDPDQAPPPIDVSLAPQDGVAPLDARADGRADQTQPGPDAPPPHDTKPSEDAPPAQDLPCSPKPELCNGFDDNCDGKVDENLTRDCYTGSSGCTPMSNGAYDCVGLCQAGTQTCSIGSWSPCNGQILPQQELCNNKDDNCNGQKDESLMQPCYPAGFTGCTKAGGSYTCEGVCKSGIQVCSAGVWGGCSGAQVESAEVCNNKDDDCDGTPDDGALCPSMQVCTNGMCK